MSYNNKLVWIGALMDPSGYGEASRNYVLNLAAKGGIDIKIKPRYYWTGGLPVFAPDVYKSLFSMLQTEIGPSDLYQCVQHTTPDTWTIQPGNCHRMIGMTTFETDGVPDHWQMNMRAMDEIWTFSQWSQNIFLEKRANHRVFVVPHGVDTDRFNPGEYPLEELSFPDHFIFGANFDWTERKNPGALLRAYFTTFKASDPVVLVLKTYHQYPLERSKQFIQSYIDAVRKELGLTDTTAPKVALFHGITPASIMPRFYASLDAYVVPSRGEGWGLTYTEAMASGLPTIAVNWSGHTDFMDDQNSLLVKNYKLVEVSPEDAAYQRQYIGHQWADCDEEELGHHMRTLFEDRDLGGRLGAQARQDMLSDYTWSRVTERMNDLLFPQW